MSSERPLKLDTNLWCHLVVRGDWPGKTSTGVAVAFVLFDHRNKHAEAWPSIETIGREAGGLSRRTVERQLSALAQAGVIEVRSGKLRGATNRYRLTDPFIRATP